MPSRQSGIGRIMEWWRERVGEVVTTEQIREVSGIQSSSRRIRELRQIYGWEIDSFRSHSDLKPSEYRLAAAPANYKLKFSTGISSKLRSQVLARNNSICRLCGLAAGEKYEDGTRVTLQVDHIQPRDAGGSDEMDNLRTLCHRCNEGAKNFLTAPSQTLRQLKGLVRNANRETQEAIYEFLKSKFEEK